jgi:UDP-3-O-[3-hydroxymyristoyl] glucosamine N-acyltransferase
MPTLQEIATITNGIIVGNKNEAHNTTITTIVATNATCNTPCSITYFANKKFAQAILKNPTPIVFTTQELQPLCNDKIAIIVKNPTLAVARLSQVLSQTTHTIHASAIIHPSATLGKNVQISAHCYIGKNATIGDNCYMYPNVTIMDNVTIGDNSIIASGCVIGSQGFGNVLDANKQWHTIYHFGGVRIGNNVHIGANTCIDNGTFSDTTIADGVRIDNLVHIAHNVHIGEHTAIAAKTGIAGSTTIGKRCQIGGKVGIVGHLNIVDDVVIYATSTVNKSIKKAGIYTGFFPIIPHYKWKKIAFLLTKFDKIAKYLNIKLRTL